LILLTNDDGILSPGLLAAAGALAGLGDLLIVAPATQQTGMGRSMPAIANSQVSRETLLLDGRPVEAYAVPGTPAQAVLYAVLVLAPRRPALAVAGINYGENLGSIITGSGTVGAALEAAAAGIPALAVSLETDKAYHYVHGADVSWDTAVAVTRRLAEAVLARALPFDVDVLNVNLPAGAAADTPWRITRQSRQPYFENFRAAQGDRFSLADLDYRVNIHWDSLEPDSDIRAFASDRVISITPLSIDLTARVDLEALAGTLLSPPR
jgi:5'-nucleotidase